MAKKIDISKLVRMSTYAKIRNVTTPCVLNWIKGGKVETVTIDNTIFLYKEDMIEPLCETPEEPSDTLSDKKRNKKNKDILSNSEYNLIYDTWNSMIASLPVYRQGKLKSVRNTAKRNKKIHILLVNNHSSSDELIKLIKTIPYADKWIFGETERNWRITFDWLVEDVNGWYVKAIDGNMHNNDKRTFEKMMNGKNDVQYDEEEKDTVKSKQDSLVIDGLIYE